MNLNHVFAITVFFNDRESETLHMTTDDGHVPTRAEIDALVRPYAKKLWHESGGYEVTDIQSVQKSIDHLLSYSNKEPS